MQTTTITNSKYALYGCRGCKAWIFKNGKYKCKLGYSIQNDNTPTEMCPRPLTYLAMMELQEKD